jgi:DNA-binding winged helix-turn-helix (wHTH) protein/tetratricopeptide (TPR) repeat protein
MNYPVSPDTRRGSYVFDRFRLSDDGMLLLEEGAAVAAAPKVLQTLLVLVRHAGQVVTKEDLFRAVWPDVFVEDTGLTRNVSLLRQVLGDDGQRFIATIPRIGYRFVAAVEHVATAPLVRDKTSRSIREKTRQPLGASRAQITVGHWQERASLEAAFGATAEGSGRLIAVSGEPGIGKSTVVEGFLSTLSEECLVGRGRCSERLAGAEPHLAVLEAIDELLVDDPSLVTSLRRFAPTWYVHVAPRFSGGHLEARLPEQIPAGSPERLMRELTVFLEEISRSRPVVIFIDDLHWSDISTVDLLAHLATRLARMRVMIILAYRSNEMAATSHPFNRLRDELISRGHLAESAVSLLTVQDVRDYVSLLLGQGNAPSELPSLIYRKTEGNPLFMTDLVRYLQANGLIDRNAVDMTSEVPESLKSMIERTLQGLDPDTRQLLRVSALHGNEFESAIIADVIGRAAAEVEEQLQTLARVHGLVAIVREHKLPDGTVSLKCRFVHALYQNALYASIPPSRRAEWAHRIAEALADCYGKQTQLIASELAVLFEIGLNSREASRYFLTASRTAAARFAFREAVDLARRGLASFQAIAGAKSRDAARLEFDLTFALFVPLATVAGYGTPDTEKLTRRLLQLCDKIQDANATSAALAASGVVSAGRGECLATVEIASRLIALGQSTANEVFLMNGHMLAVIAIHHMGRFHEAQKHIDAAIALDERGHHSERRMAILDPIVVTLSESSRNAWTMGYLKRAPEYAARGIEVARRVRDPDSLAFAWLFDGFMHACRQNWTACLTSVENGIAIASEVDSAQTLAWNRCGRGWALAHLGRLDEGFEELMAGIESSKRIWGQICLSQLSVFAADVLLLRDDIDGAQAWVSQGLEVANRHSEHFVDAELHRLSAICLLQRQQRDAAGAELKRAVDIARSQDAATFELRAALTLAEHDFADWQNVLKSVLARFPEPEPWPEVLEARRLVQ